MDLSISVEAYTNLSWMQMSTSGWEKTLLEGFKDILP